MLFRSRSDRKKTNYILNAAKDIIVSPITIYKEVNKYAKHNKLDKIDLEKLLYAATSNFTKDYQLISEVLCKAERPEVGSYIHVSEEFFHTIFFNLLKQYHKKRGITLSYIRKIIDIPITDAKEIYDFIVNASN